MKKKDYIYLANWYMDYADGKDPPITNITKGQFNLSGDVWNVLPPLEDGPSTVQYNQKCRDAASILYSEAQKEV